MQIGTIKKIRHAHIFCGIGGGAKGFNKGSAKVGNLEAEFECIGGIDVDPAACRDFTNQVGVPATCMDLFTRDQYMRFHGRTPPKGWVERTLDDVRRAFMYLHPHIVFLSAPCKGFSGLLSEKMSATSKYQALNELTLRGVWVALEAHKDDPVELYVFENVPRIATRGRHLLDQIIALFRSYGYAVAETTHDCGEIGNLGQSRKRFLLVARYIAKVPTFLYEPVKHRLRGVGEILDRLPMPGLEPGIGGPMHRMPALQWKTWVRLAFVRAGADWRSLNDLRVADGHLQDFGILPDNYAYGGALGVKRWTDVGATVSGMAHATRGAFNVADPRYFDWHPGASSSKLRVTDWPDPARPITGSQQVASGAGAVADPRLEGTRFNNTFRIVAWGETSPAIAGPGGPAGGLSIADPRPDALSSPDRTAYVTGGHYGVIPWDQPSGAVPAHAKNNNGPWSVADPRKGNIAASRDEAIALPDANDKLVCCIRALDGTWHRPFTTLELAALQGLVDPEEQLILDGLSDAAWRERIGNMVPPPAASAIAGVCGVTLLAAWSGQTFMMGSTPIWVRPVAAALMAAQGE